MKNNKCPCCGAQIKVGQEECLNCRVYLWPSEEKDRVKHGLGEVTAESAIKALHEAAEKLTEEDFKRLEDECFALYMGR